MAPEANFSSRGICPRKGRTWSPHPCSSSVEHHPVPLGMIWQCFGQPRCLQYLGAQINDQAASAPLQSDPCTSRKQASIRLPTEGSWPCLSRAWTFHSHHGKRFYSPKISNRRKKNTLLVAQIKYLMINFLWHVYPVMTSASAPKLSKVNVITEISCHIS